MKREDSVGKRWISKLTWNFRGGPSDAAKWKAQMDIFFMKMILMHS